MAGVITYQMVVDQSGAVKSIQQFDGVLRTSEESIERNTQAIKRNKNALGEQERTANLAGMAALELSRTISDSAYGIRGMANNIGQLVTIFAMMSVQTNAATGAALGLRGAIMATWKAMMGPMGIVFAIQGLLSFFTLWSNKNREVAESQDEITEAMKRFDRHMTSSTLIPKLESLRLNLEGIAGDQAMKDLEKIIPNYEKLIQAMSVDTILDQYIKYLRLKEDEDRLGKIIYENSRKHEEALRVEKGMYEDGKSTLEEIDVIRQKGLTAHFTALRAEEQLKRTQEERLKLERLFRVEKEATGKVLKQEVLDGYEFLGIMQGIYELGQFFNREKFLEEYLGEAPEQLKSIRQQIDEISASLQSLGYVNANSMFGNDSLETVRLFSQHLEATADILWYVGDTFGSVLGAVSEDNQKLQKDLFNAQKAFGIASVTIDTIIAMSKVTAETPFLAAIQNAAILARGLAAITAIATQKLNGKSNLRGASAGANISRDETARVATTGFSNLAGGERPNQAIRVYVMEGDIRTTQDRSQRTRVRARL